jgi:hypothetical protein
MVRLIPLGCILFAAIAIAVPTRGNAQDSLTHRGPWWSGIEVRYGVGHLALRDEHISNEAYTGPLTRISVDWSRRHETYGFRLGLEYASTTRLMNYNISSEVHYGRIRLADEYPVGSVSLLGHEAFIVLGPRVEFLVYYRQQHIAQNPDATPDIYQSGFWLASIGVAGDLLLPLQPSLHADLAVALSALSLGGGTGSSAETFTGLTLLTPFAAARVTAGLGLTWIPATWLSVRIGYGLDVTSIDSWNTVVMLSDNLLFSVRMTF